MPQINKNERLRQGELLDIIIQKQLDVVGKTIEDVIKDDNFRFNTTITREQYKSFRRDVLFLIQKNLKINRTKASNSFKWFYDNYGLRIKN